LGYWLDCWFSNQLSNQLSNQHPQHPQHHRLKLPPGPLLVHLGPGRNAIQGDVEQHLHGGPQGDDLLQPTTAGTSSSKSQDSILQTSFNFPS
jgi:hypothetical protein